MRPIRDREGIEGGGRDGTIGRREKGSSSLHEEGSPSPPPPIPASAASLVLAEVGCGYITGVTYRHACQVLTGCEIQSPIRRRLFETPKTRNINCVVVSTC